jgi:1,4-alpha-glucan branching enzyme
MPGRWVRVFSSDEARFGGSGFETPHEVETEPIAAHGLEHSLNLHLPPLGALVLAPA